jgi:hypothetical protein
MCTNTEEFELSFGRNILKNEFVDQAEWEMMSFHVSISSKNSHIKLNSVALVRERTIPTERPPPVGEVSANLEFPYYR